MKPYNPLDADELIAPECRATVDRIQRALDGDAAPDALDADPHLGACPTCRERLRAARVLLSVLATPSEVAFVPADFTNRVVNAVWDDRHAQTRRGVYKTAAWLALAAAVLIGVFYLTYQPSRPSPNDQVVPVPLETAKQPEVAPAPREKTPTPEPRPIRIGNEFAKAGQALRDAPKPITDSVAVAPKLLDMFAGAFTNPMPEPNPMGIALEPTRKSLADLPDAARTGLAPVTGTAQKAFDRLLRDVASVKPKPNS